MSSVTVVNVVPNEVPNVRCIMTGKPEIAIWKETLLVEEGDTARLPCAVQVDYLYIYITVYFLHFSRRTRISWIRIHPKCIKVKMSKREIHYKRF